MNTDFKARFDTQFAELKARFMELQPRERVIIVVGSVLVLLTAIYTLGLAPLYKAVNDHNKSVTQKQQDLAWMQSVAGRISAMNSAMPSAGNTESMVVLIANSASGSGVASAMVGQTPDGANGVRVQFEGVQFDALVLWLGGLQKDYAVHVKAAEINRTAQPGQVNASLTLAR